MRAGGFSPDLVNRLVFSFQGETRTADMVTLPFAAAAEPPAPTDEQLQRQYDDNANDYRAPEYRRVKAGDPVAGGLAQGHHGQRRRRPAYYDSHKAISASPRPGRCRWWWRRPRRRRRRWPPPGLTGADWDAMQKQAAARTPPRSRWTTRPQAAFPSPDLAGPVFAAPPNAVTGPVNADGSWAVFRVTKVAGAAQQPFEALRPDVKQRAALEQATDQVYDRANKVQDLLAAGPSSTSCPAGWASPRSPARWTRRATRRRASRRRSRPRRRCARR